MNYFRAISISLLLFLFNVGIAQNIQFSFVDPQPEIMEVYSGDIQSADLDNDGDMDIIQSGIGENLMGQSASVSVFLNNGLGDFTQKEQNFNLFFSTERITVGDLDNDGDIDLIVSANNRTDFYRNDGLANFIYQDGTPFEPSDSGELIIGDVDEDGDNDVLHFGSLFSNQPFARLYINDGTGIFSDASQNFEGLNLAQIAFIDADNDSDLDILNFGENPNGEPLVRLYENDGLGNYTTSLDPQITPISAEEISVGDIDNDGDQDFLINGVGAGSMATTALYINEGNGQFNRLDGTGFPDVFAGSNAFADLDNDADLDILLIGSMDGGLPNIFSIVFENLGNNNFIAVDSLGGEYIAKNTVADFNGDGMKDIIIQGFVEDTSLYWNSSILSSTADRSNPTFSVFPNPTDGMFNVKWEEDTVAAIELIDQTGKLVLSRKVEKQNQININLHTASGMYILRILEEDHVRIEKLFIIE